MRYKKIPQKEIVQNQFGLTRAVAGILKTSLQIKLDSFVVETHA